MSPPCPETSEVEALWDGRLGADREEIMRTHVASCEHCAGEARRLETLRTALLSLPEREPSPPNVARGRRLLLDAAREATARARPRGRALPFAAAGVALAAGVAFWTQRPPALDRGSAAASDPSAQARSGGELEVRVTPESGARWSRTSEGERELLSLAQGKIEIAVDRHGGARRLAVRLPDGELEDEGTVFSVRVSRERTEEVSVSAGSVMLRLAQQPPRRLTAGQTFVAAPPATAEGAKPAEARENASPDSAPRAREEPTSARSSPRTATSASDADACPGAPRFEDCVEAFKRGDYAAAADAFARYSASCGRHAEDATYLRMVSLARAGRPTEARELARSYLTRFPEGFRHKEAERLAHGD